MTPAQKIAEVVTAASCCPDCLCPQPWPDDIAAVAFESIPAETTVKYDICESCSATVVGLAKEGEGGYSPEQSEWWRGRMQRIKEGRK